MFNALEGTPDIIGSWTQISGQTPHLIIGDGYIGNVDFASALPGNYEFIYTAAGDLTCGNATAVVIVAVNSPITVSITSDVVFVCDASPIAVLTAVASGGSGQYEYTWPVDGTSDGAKFTTNVLTSTQSFIVTVTDIGFIGATCTASSSIEIIFSDICPGYAPTTKVDNLIGSELTSLESSFDGNLGDFSSNIFQLREIPNTSPVAFEVLIDIIVNDGVSVLPGSEFVNLLTGYGVNALAISINNLIVTTYFPVDSLLELTSANSLINFVRPVYPGISNQEIIREPGGTRSAGDATQGSDVARDKYQLTGAGIKVGVLSDSYANPGQGFVDDDIRLKELP